MCERLAAVGGCVAAVGGARGSEASVAVGGDRRLDGLGGLPEAGLLSKQRQTVVALAARIVSRSPSWLSDATPSKRRGTLHMEESVADSAGAPAPEAAPARVEVAVGAADILGVGGVAGVAGAADVAGLVGVASPASSSCAARSVSSAASCMS